MISDIPLHLTVGLSEQDWPRELDAGLELLAGPSAATLLEQTRALHEEWHGAGEGRISILLGPSAPQRCSSELLDGCAELSRELGVPVHTHLLETRVQGTDPRARLNRLESHGLLNDRLIAAHGVWVDAEEISGLGAAGAALVHNPQSNLQIGSGIAALRQWRDDGVTVALGTDGANCGGSLDMLSSMKLATLLHRPGIADERDWETPWSILETATIDGARALGLDGVGRLEPGWKADIAIFPLSGTPFMAGDDPLAELVLSSLSSLAKHVLVDGRIVVEDGAVAGVDMSRLAVRAHAAREAIFTRNADRIALVAEAQRGILSDRVRSTGPLRDVVEFREFAG